MAKSNERVALFDRFFNAALRRSDIEEQQAIVEDQPHSNAYDHYNKKHEESTTMAKKKQQNMGKMSLRSVKPLTFTQEEVFKAWMSGGNLVLHGLAGTGKSFIAVYLALKEIERYQLNYDKVIIIRSGVPSRDLGYLPGDLAEKAKVYEEPYELIVNKLYERGDAYMLCKNHGRVEFTTTSFLRGITFERAVVIVDEIQNMSYGELSTIITRLGDNCRVIFSGDFRQSDLFRIKEKEGLHHFLNIVERMPEFTCHEFNISDIVRGKLVKSFITEEDDYRKEKRRADPSYDF